MEKFDCQVFEISDSVSELITSGASVPMYVSGSSMNPFLISRRDVVWLSRYKNSDLRVGKIVLFRRNNGSLVLHRITKLLPEERIVVRGDAQTWTEEINKEHIIAVVTDIQRKGVKRSVDSVYWKIVDTVWRMLTPLRSVFMRVWFKIRRKKK